MIEIKRDLANLSGINQRLRQHFKGTDQKRAEKKVVNHRWKSLNTMLDLPSWTEENILRTTRARFVVSIKKSFAWSFSHDVLWADAVIFCRPPAMYPYFRAISFAKECGKQTYAEIDDLLFTLITLQTLSLTGKLFQLNSIKTSVLTIL